MAALVLCCIAMPLHAAEEGARVLILNGLDPYAPSFLAFDKAMHASLANATAKRVVYFSESLDAQRFPQETLEAEFVALFARKYSTQRIDVVVTVSETALKFYERHGERLWPGARLCT